jgi:hypothetical protein
VHGTLGWTIGYSLGCLITDLLDNRRPEISTEGLALDRYPPLLIGHQWVRKEYSLASVSYSLKI